MFKRSFASKDRAGKATKPKSKSSFVSSHHAKQALLSSLDKALPPVRDENVAPNSAVVTVCVGPDGRLFAAHEEILNRSPYFADAIRELFFAGTTKRIDLTNEDPETFSCVLEYLYRGDYSPRLLQSKRGAYLEGSETDVALSPHSLKSTVFKKDASARSSNAKATLYYAPTGATILRDTSVYCLAGALGLSELQRLALRKQGLQSGVDVGTILRSMRFAYAHTPDSDSRLRAHFLALIVRARKTFKRSGTMQAEMTQGGAMFFDLFVALCNHLDDVASVNTTPKTV